MKGLNQKIKNLSFEYAVPGFEHNLEPICHTLNELGLCQFNYSKGGIEGTKFTKLEIIQGNSEYFKIKRFSFYWVWVYTLNI